MVTLPITDELSLDTARVRVTGRVAFCFSWLSKLGLGCACLRACLRVCMRACVLACLRILSAMGYRNPVGFSFWSEDLSSRLARD